MVFKLQGLFKDFLNKIDVTINPIYNFLYILIVLLTKLKRNFYRRIINNKDQEIDKVFIIELFKD